jgi:glycosyltransferase involved in cell wall biosynthesis
VQEDGCKFALVVPTLNEAGNIEPLLNQVVGSLSHASSAWEILVV